MKQKSKLLQSIDTMIESHTVKRIHVTRTQYEKLCYELWPYGTEQKNKSNFVYRNHTVQIWPCSPSEAPQRGY